MEYNFSNRFKNLKPSPAGDILATMGDPSLIKFSGGNPATDSFPIDKITEFSNEVLTNKPLSILEYGLTEGTIIIPRFSSRHLLSSNNFNVLIRLEHIYNC